MGEQRPITVEVIVTYGSTLTFVTKLVLSTNSVSQSIADRYYSLPSEKNWAPPGIRRSPYFWSCCKTLKTLPSFTRKV